MKPNTKQETKTIKKILLFLAYNIMGIIIGFVVSLTIAFILTNTKNFDGLELIFLIILGTTLGHSLGICIFLFKTIPVKNIFLKILLIITFWFISISFFITNFHGIP